MRPGQLNSQISHLNSTKCQVFSMGSVVSISSTGSHATCWWSQGWHVFFHINDLPAHHQGWHHGISPRGLSKKTWLPPFLPANRYDMDWYGLIKGIESTITRSLTHALLIRPLLILAWNNGGTVCFFWPLRFLWMKGSWCFVSSNKKTHRFLQFFYSVMLRKIHHSSFSRKIHHSCRPLSLPPISQGSFRMF